MDEPSTLEVGRYDQASDSIVIEGIRDSGSMFRQFGVGQFGAMVGRPMMIQGRGDGVLTITNLQNADIRGGVVMQLEG